MAKKDILIVVRNQLNWIKACISSIEKNTEDYNLFIWNNGSDGDTTSYLRSLNATLLESDVNMGFIEPNNKLASIGNSPYIILLNSDTIVIKDWDTAMISMLEICDELKQVGYMGFKLDSEFRGTEVAWGWDVDFISGWCFCFPRDIYNKYGLFDSENLSFAYGEDADFSLRLKEAGYKIYASRLNLVYHEGNVTIKEVISEYGEKIFLDNFNKNHEYLKKRWATIE